MLTYAASSLAERRSYAVAAPSSNASSKASSKASTEVVCCRCSTHAVRAAACLHAAALLLGAATAYEEKKNSLLHL